MAYNINICSKFRQKMIDLFEKNMATKVSCIDLMFLAPPYPAAGSATDIAKIQMLKILMSIYLCKLLFFSSTPRCTQVVRMVLRMVSMVVT